MCITVQQLSTSVLVKRSRLTLLFAIITHLSKLLLSSLAYCKYCTLSVLLNNSQDSGQITVSSCVGLVTHLLVNNNNFVAAIGTSAQEAKKPFNCSSLIFHHTHVMAIN